MRPARGLPYLAACVFVVGYSGLSHYCNIARARNLGAALGLIPVTALVMMVAWRFKQRVVTLTGAGVAALIYRNWPLLQANFSLLYLLQDVGAYGFLGLTFGRSLGRDRTALCTRLADRLHGPLSPREVRYTRRVTAAWAMFFFSVAALSVLLFWAAPLRVWSIYMNFCVLPLIGVMFAAEYLVRRRVLPKVARAGLVETVRVYFAGSL